ncbi:MAG: aldehyde dehydrogenase (NADP(+)) [Opitutia bacterium Tous-C1TDCM]|nr:MAG: aldehyde dehydrogenase (NADP(+)) [Opitutae bacterium Tous-C1TDCM]
MSTFTARHARTGEVLATYAEAAPAQVDASVAAAVAAAPVFAAASGAQRAALLEKIADEIVALGAPLLELAHAETALPLPRLEGERGRTAGQFRLFAALVREGSWVDARIDPALPQRQPLPRPDLRRMLRPLGPVAVFGASNFPLAFSVAGGDTASALAAGNPVVVKAHPAHPGTSDLVAGAIARAVAACGLPAGVFAMVHGTTPATSLALVRHPAIEAVGFTGSARAGRALFDAAAARPRPIPVFAEMSSLNPVFLLPAALQERGPALAEGLAGSFTLGVGQFCTKPGLVVGVASPAWDAFVAALAAKAQSLPAGTMLHAGIAAAFTAGLAELKGVTWLAQGGGHVAHIAASDLLAHPELAHEVFGPFTLLVTARDAAEVRAVAAALDGQLTATLHGTDADFADAADLFAVLERKAGRVLANGFPTGVEVAPAMHHGGPYPATTDTRFTSVGTAAIFRFARPVCYQNIPEALLPAELKNANPLGLLRLLDGKPTRDPL